MIFLGEVISIKKNSVQWTDVSIVQTLYTNPDNSLDIYMDQLTLTLIPVYIAMAGSQIVIVRIGTIDTPIWV